VRLLRHRLGVSRGRNVTRSTTSSRLAREATQCNSRAGEPLPSRVPFILGGPVAGSGVHHAGGNLQSDRCRGARSTRAQDHGPQCPGSGSVARNLWAKLDYLTTRDEVKFAVGDRADYEWAREVIVAWGVADRIQDGSLNAQADLGAVLYLEDADHRGPDPGRRSHRGRGMEARTP